MSLGSLVIQQRIISGCNDESGSYMGDCQPATMGPAWLTPQDSGSRAVPNRPSLLVVVDGGYQGSDGDGVGSGEAAVSEGGAH